MFARPTVQATSCLGPRLQRLPNSIANWTEASYHWRQRRHEHNSSVAPTLERGSDSSASDGALPRLDDGQAGSGPGKVIPIGRIHRIRGRMRREAYEPLKTQSLGKQTEILMLKDVPDLDDPAEPVNIKTRASTDTIDKVSAKEIEALIADQTAVSQPEVLEAIRECRPSEDVLSRQDFEIKVKELTDKFNLSQLQRFIRKEHIIQQRQQDRQALSDDIPSAELDEITHIPWSNWLITKQQRDHDARSQIVGSNRKQRQTRSVAEHIVRVVWGIQLDEEANAIGTITLKLSEPQWALLQSKGAEDLLAVMRTGRFYRNSRIEWKILEKSGDRWLQIIGPRSEAEGLAQIVRSAFHKANSAYVNLRLFKLRPQSALFVSGNITEITQATQSHITYTEDHQGIYIFALTECAKDNALRRLLALIERPADVSELVTTYDAKDCAGGSMHLSSALSSSSRMVNMARFVCEQTGLPGRIEDILDLESKHAKFLLKHLRAELPDNQISSGTRRKRKTDSRGLSDAGYNVSYWRTGLVSTPWRATFGLLLVQDSSPKGNASSTEMFPPVARKSKETFPREFVAHAPNLAEVLEKFEASSEQAGLQQLLRLRLIPSPLDFNGDLGSWRSRPAIEIDFELSNTIHAGQDDTRPRFWLGGESYMHLQGMFAVSQMSFVDLACPSLMRDIRFSRRSEFQADVERLMADPDLRSFIDKVVESAKIDEDDLQAPPCVRIALPVMNSSIGRKNRGSSRFATYLFAGFEYRTSRRFVPEGITEFSNPLIDGHVVEVSDVQGGIIGGRRTEMSVRSPQDFMDSHDSASAQSLQLLRSTLNMLDMTERVHGGGWNKMQHLRQD